MPNNNPTGINGFEGFGADQPYGAELRQHELAQAVPVPSGGANAPQSAQRRAVRGSPRGQGAPQPPPGGVVPPALQSPPSYPAWLAASWARVAAEPGASELVKQIAQQAQQQVQGG